MADRRMISRAVFQRDSFFDLPHGAQALYTQYILESDDEGFVSGARRIARMLRASEEDIKALTAGGFLIMLDTGVAYIRHWRMQNSIRRDRFRPTVYTKEIEMLGDEFISRDDTRYEIALDSQSDNQGDRQSDSQCDRQGDRQCGDDSQLGNQTGIFDSQCDRHIGDILATQYSIDKNRIEKKREDEIKIDNLRKEEDSNAITNCDIDNIGEGYMDSFEEVVPPPEEEAPPDYSEALGLPEPLVGEGQAAPTLGEIKAFIAKNGFYLVDAEAFYKYYNKHGWEKAVNWKEKVLHWHFNNNPKWRRQS